MIAHEVAGKYAGAVFQSAKAKGLLDPALDQFGQLKLLIDSEPKLLAFLSAPSASDEDKVALVRRLLEGRLETLFIEFLVVLINKHRISFLPGIIDEIIRLVEAQKGIGRATVITAVPLSGDQREKIIARLEKRSSLSVRLEEKVDPAVIAGAVVIMAGQIIDGSVRYGLSRIEEQLTRVRVH